MNEQNKEKLIAHLESSELLNVMYCVGKKQMETGMN